MSAIKSQEQLYDELLVLKCQQHDLAAFNELVGRWQPRLWRYAYRLTGRDDVACDIVQEAWVAVVKGIFRLEDASLFPSWIYRILTNRWADYTRKRVRDRRMQHEVMSSDLIASRRDQDARDSNADLRWQIERLPPGQRALLMLRYGEGFDIREIAVVLGIPEGTVKSRLFYAKQKLREGLEREQRRTE